MNKKQERFYINYPKGSKVIIKSADNNPYSVATFKELGKGNLSNIPIVEIAGQEFLCFGIMRHYSEELEKALMKLNNIEQWNVMAEFYTIKRRMD